MKVIPLGKNMLMELDDPEEEAWGVSIPVKHREQTRLGTILEIGDKVTKFEKGDRVLIYNHYGDPLYLNKMRWYNPNHRLVHEDFVPARVSEEDVINEE